MTLTMLARAGDPTAYNYFELRLYSVSSNKLDAVIERFRDTVQPVRRKHGIETIGYWTAGTTNGDKFIYLMAAASKGEMQLREKNFTADERFKEGYADSNAKRGKTVDAIVTLPLGVSADAKFNFTVNGKSRLFELRVYSAELEKLEAFRVRWRDCAVPIYDRYGLHSIGWWVDKNEDREGHNRFVAILAAKASNPSRNPSPPSTKTRNGCESRKKPRGTASCAAGLKV